jgi:hypothetical protein
MSTAASLFALRNLRPLRTKKCPIQNDSDDISESWIGKIPGWFRLGWATVVQFWQNPMTPTGESVAAETWQRTLSTIPTIFGRVAYLASLRNVNKGCYEHFGLAQRIGEAEADRILRNSHLAVFEEWLCFGVERQKDELEEYISGLEGDRREIVATWVTLHPYEDWVPAESRDVERKLFSSDLALVLELIRTDYGVASRDPDS